MNILRTNFKCYGITSQTMARDIAAVEPISVRHCWWRRFLKQASN